MTSLRRFSLGVLGFSVISALTGGYLRAVDAGGACGDSWPTCQGEWWPKFEGDVAIEFFHRIATGFLALLVIVLAFWIWKRVPPFKPARRAVLWSMISIVTQFLIGVMIVAAPRFVDDVSMVRVLTVPLHVAASFFVLATLTTVVFWLTNEDWIRGGLPSGILWIGFWMVLVAATGGGAALRGTLSGGVETFLKQVAVLHAVLSVGVGILMVVFVIDKRWSSRAAKLIVVLAGIQVPLGVATWLSGGPPALAVLHQGVASGLWVTWVWLGAGMSAAKGVLLAGPPWAVPSGRVLFPRSHTRRFR